jgi:MarR family transcriptional regulator, 2-MHQ and catechol-resistance regulon repressor
LTYFGNPNIIIFNSRYINSRGVDSFVNSNLSLKLYRELSITKRNIAVDAAENVRCYGLSLTEFAVLELIFHTGDQPLHHIGKKILVSSANLTYVLDKLESKRLITRETYPIDRRIIFAVLTGYGRKLMENIFPKHESLIHQLCNDLGESEKETLINLLKKIGRATACLKSRN